MPTRLECITELLEFEMTVKEISDKLYSNFSTFISEMCRKLYSYQCKLRWQKLKNITSYKGMLKLQVDLITDKY